MNKTIEILISKRSCNFQEQCISNYNWSRKWRTMQAMLLMLVVTATSCTSLPNAAHSEFGNPLKLKQLLG